MSLVSVDRVHETSNSVGIGPFTFLGPEPNFRSFNSVMASEDTCFYAAIDREDHGWETGLGTWLANGTLARTAIVSSSTGGPKVSWGGGIRDVVITVSPIQVTNIISRSPLAGGLTGVESIGGSQYGSDVKISLDDLTNFVAGRIDVLPGTGTGLPPVNTLRPAGTLNPADAIRIARPDAVDPLDKDVRSTVGDLIALIPPSNVDPSVLASKLDVDAVGETIVPLVNGMVPDQYVRPALVSVYREGSDLVLVFSDGSTQRVSLASIPPAVLAALLKLESSGSLLLENGSFLLQEV